MTPSQQVWAMTYAATLQGLLSNPEATFNWSNLRERAVAEANLAVYYFEKALP